jgi:hypothetical protein
MNSSDYIEELQRDPKEMERAPQDDREDEPYWYLLGPDSEVWKQHEEYRKELEEYLNGK